MNKKTDIIIACVSLLVLAAILSGVVFLSTSVGDDPKTTETSVGDVDSTLAEDVNKETSNSSGVVVTYPDFWMDTDNRHLGYITEGDITTFFIAVESPLVFQDGASTWRIQIDYADIKKVSSYSYKPLYSLDGGHTWNYLSTTVIEGVPSSENYTLDVGGMAKGVEVLLAYTQVEKCLNPMAVLGYIKTEIFSDTLVFNTIADEPYVTYSGFQYYKNIILPNNTAT